MTTYLPLTVSVLYFATAGAFLLKKQYPWAAVWFSYACANCALVWAQRSEI